MNKYKRFTKIADCVVEISKSLTGMSIFDTSSISNGLTMLMPEEYQRVKTALFPSFYPHYGYTPAPNQVNWNRPWDANSPVPQNPYRQQPPIYGAQQSQSSIDDMFKCMDEEESDIEDATNFVNAIKQFLPTGHIKNDMSIMGEIVNAVRAHEYVKASDLVKNNWVEVDTIPGEAPAPCTINTDSSFHCNCGAFVGESLLGQKCNWCGSEVKDWSKKTNEDDDAPYIDPLDDISD